MTSIDVAHQGVGHGVGPAGALAALATAAALFVALPDVARAQDVRFSSQATQDCLNDFDYPETRNCIGVSANACIGATADGSTTVGMGDCLNREYLFWDARLNEIYKELRASEKAEDAEMKKIGSSAPALAPALRDMQRAWITYRDATCDYEMAQWGGGTGGGPAVVECLMRMTGEQTLYLDTRLNGW